MTAMQSRSENIFSHSFGNRFYDDMDDLSLFDFDEDLDCMDAPLTSRSSAGGNEDSNVAAVPNKRKKSIVQHQRNKYLKASDGYGVVPRGISTDIRHTYSSMFVNMFNTFEYPLWTNYFNTYCTSDLLFIETSPKSVRPNLPKYIEIIGAELSSQFMFSRMQIIPDAILQIKKTKLFTRTDTAESLVVSSFVIKGTKLYDIYLEALLPPALQLSQGVVKLSNNGTAINAGSSVGGVNNTTACLNHLNNAIDATPSSVVVDSCPASSNMTPSSSSTSLESNSSSSSSGGMDSSPTVDDAAIASYQKIIDRCPKLERPMDVTISGTITMYLDSNKRIRKFEFKTTSKVVEVPENTFASGPDE